MDSRPVLDVTDATFEAEVVEASRERPIVVDFWAPWCGPCRTLGPLLERLATESEGAFQLAKVDIDQNPAIAQSFGVQSIPFVVAFKDGQIASEFVGAQPESVIRQFLDRILPDEADTLAKEGDALVDSGEDASAEATFRRALEVRPRHARASLGLARLLATSERQDEAATLLESVTADGPVGQEIERLSATLRMDQEESGDEAELRRQFESDPPDLAAGLHLGRLLASSGRHEEALAVFLEGVRRDREFDDAAARKAMLDLFTVLGRDDPLVDEYQRKLSQVMFS